MLQKLISSHLLTMIVKLLLLAFYVDRQIDRHITEQTDVLTDRYKRKDSTCLYSIYHNICNTIVHPINYHSLNIVGR